MNFNLKRYQPTDKSRWDQFVRESKNGTFLLCRDFMDYHADRFEDHSLMIYRDERLYALLPASAHGTQLRSHGGLTYGGLIMGNKVTTEEAVSLFAQLKSYLREAGFTSLLYRPTPYIYHRLPAQEDLYALWREGATLVGRDAAMVIDQTNRLKFRDIRKSGIRRAQKQGLTLSSEPVFAPFWQILIENLRQKYGVNPVHSLTEIELLHSRFPDQIRLHTVLNGSDCLGGCVMFVTPQVAHVQYISASPAGKDSGALDLLFSHLITEEYASVPYFDFGKSTEADGSLLNSDLAYQKEGFGARTICYDTYQLNTKQNTKFRLLPTLFLIF